MEKNYSLKMFNSGKQSGINNRKKILLAQIVLLVCIIILIAARSFGM